MPSLSTLADLALREYSGNLFQIGRVINRYVCVCVCVCVCLRLQYLFKMAKYGFRNILETISAVLLIFSVNTKITVIPVVFLLSISEI